jgi:hypothetical protein
VITYRNIGNATINLRLSEGRRFVIAPNKTFDVTAEQADEIDALNADPATAVSAAREV